MSDTNQNILLLCYSVEQSIDHRVATSSDFIYLAGVISGRLNESISVSTLKRIWGYIDGYHSVREHTLDILAMLVGYPDFETFVSDYCQSDAVRSSQIVFTKPLNIEDLQRGDRVELQWNPGRLVRLEYLSDSKFKVLYSEKSKIKKGDTFICRSFYLHHPYFLENLVHQNEEPCNFVIGNKGGLTVVRKLAEDEITEDACGAVVFKL